MLVSADSYCYSRGTLIHRKTKVNHSDALARFIHFAELQIPLIEEENMASPELFQPITLRDLTIKNRIVMSPMCMYSSVEGKPTTWHQSHLGARAIGGVGLVIAEATAVTPTGRITPDDSGLWNEEQMQAWKPITEFIKSQGAVAGIQIAHAGRKASRKSPFIADEALPDKDGGWEVMGVSNKPYNEKYELPHAMTAGEIETNIEAWKNSTKLAVEAGFQLLEIHMAHGYLLHSFLSPMTNDRTDEYGGSYENRTRFPLAVAKTVRETLPDELPLSIRISVTDWIETSWDVDQSVLFCRTLKDMGIDIIDCSSGGIMPGVIIPIYPGYQVQLAEKIRHAARIPVTTVGLISSPHQAESILREKRADMVMLGRELLREPFWAMKAARALDYDMPLPKQYSRAKR